MGRFGKERTACPLLLAASAPEATVDRSLYTPPALRCPFDPPQDSLQLYHSAMQEGCFGSAHLALSGTDLHQRLSCAVQYRSIYRSACDLISATRHHMPGLPHRCVAQECDGRG